MKTLIAFHVFPRRKFLRRMRFARAGPVALCSGGSRSPKLGVKSHKHNGIFTGSSKTFWQLLCTSRSGHVGLGRVSVVSGGFSSVGLESHECFGSFGDQFLEPAGPVRTMFHFYFSMNGEPKARLHLVPESALSRNVRMF